MVLVARSIAEVTSEINWADIRGTVQTVFPPRPCSSATPEESATQDVGGIYHDSYHPLEDVEGYRKVLKITLRDLSAGPGYLHRINAYFYDALADAQERLGPGEEIAISGPGKALVAREQPAGAGDHPFCLILRDDPDEEGVVFGRGGGGGGKGDEGFRVEAGITVTRVTEGQRPRNLAEEGLAGGQRRDVASRGRAGGTNKARGSGAGTGKGSYVYTNLASLRASDARANVYGVVCSFTHRYQSKGRDVTVSLSLVDESQPDPESAVPCNFFMPTGDGLPAAIMVGDIVRVHRAKLQDYKGRPQLVGCQGVAWIVVRKKKAVRETFQKAFPVRVCGAGSSPKGTASDEDLEPDEDSQRSGPDAGGGEVDPALPATDWEVQASSAHYTLDEGDCERCRALSEWFAAEAPRMLLSPRTEQRVRVQDIFQCPRGPGSCVVESEADLVCFVASELEAGTGERGSPSTIYVADGSGFDAFESRDAYKDAHKAALLKAMRFALGERDWHPPKTNPPAVTAFLKVEIGENREEWEALALSPGMWIRLRRLAIVKNRATSRVQAIMKDRASSVNPLHPSMAEVQAVAREHVGRCESRAAILARLRSARAPAATDSAAAGRGAVPSSYSSSASYAHKSDHRGDVEGGAAGPAQRVLPTRGDSSTPCPAEHSDRGQRHSTRAQGAWMPPSNEADCIRVGGSNGVRRGDGWSRGTKRPLAAVESGAGSGATAVVFGSERAVSNLLDVRRTPAPETFDVRAKIVAHFPVEVEGFVRPGPRAGDGAAYLFALRLKDAYGEIDAIVAGSFGRALLPGNPPPGEFQSDAALRRRIEEVLAALEREGGDLVELRLRSYVTPQGRGRSREGDRRCKRYSVVTPWCLEEAIGFRERTQRGLPCRRVRGT